MPIDDIEKELNALDRKYADLLPTEKKAVGKIQRLLKGIIGGKEFILAKDEKKAKKILIKAIVSSKEVFDYDDESLLEPEELEKKNVHELFEFMEEILNELERMVNA